MNTIKTKIGFETKPYIIEAINFHELLNVSIKTYGQILLLLATLLSLGNWAYLHSIQREKTHQLELLQKEAIQLTQHYDQLTTEYNNLTSVNHLTSLAAQLGMQEPGAEKTIYLSKSQNRS